MEMKRPRRDLATADRIEVGLIYLDIFGPAATFEFFKLFQVSERTASRIIFCEQRRRRRRNGPGQLD